MALKGGGVWEGNQHKQNKSDNFCNVRAHTSNLQNLIRWFATVDKHTHSPKFLIIVVTVRSIK